MKTGDMRRTRRTATGLLLVLALAGACGDGSSGGEEGEQNPGPKTEDTGSGY